MPQVAKRESTLLAQAACLGITVAPLLDDAGAPEWSITRGPLTVAARDLDQLEAWLHRLASADAIAPTDRVDGLRRRVARSLTRTAIAAQELHE